MPFYEKGDVRIHYEEAGSGYPLLVIPGGGLNSTVAGLATKSHRADLLEPARAGSAPTVRARRPDAA